MQAHQLGFGHLYKAVAISGRHLQPGLLRHKGNGALFIQCGTHHLGHGIKNLLAVPQTKRIRLPQ